MNGEENEKEELKEETLDFESEEEALPPPEEENDAREVNTANIIGIMAIVVLAVFSISFIAVNTGKKKKKVKDSVELDKAGVKTVIEFKDRSPVTYSSDNSERNEQVLEKSEAEKEEILDTLPSEFLLPSQEEEGTAPVRQTGSRTSYTSDRPDTKASKSPRKIEGLASLNYSSGASRLDTVSSVLNGSYSSGSKISREDFIEKQMEETRNLQDRLYGNSNGNETESSDKDSFFGSSSGNAGNGYYLSNTSLWDGTIISGALETAINTDNPGVVIARVTENVYSSKDHSYLLIPEGSLLMATYNSSVSYGQNKVQVAWNLLIRPDNYRIQLGNMNGVNGQGASGYKGMVNNHPFETLKALGMVAVYSIIQTEISGDINSEDNEYLKNTMTDLYSQASSIGNKIVNRALDIKPTIKIKEGTEIKLITNVPLELPPVEVPRAKEKYIRTR